MGVRLVTWTILAVVTWTILAAINWSVDHTPDEGCTHSRVSPDWLR
jgi:hypothetical protein